MSIAPGTQFNHYKVLSTLGAGGMGEVYRARDSRLERDVAIKVLPTQFVSEEERLERFQREARALASLNHPNITAIYGLEEFSTASGAPLYALVMELVEGPTLADRIAAGPVPLEEALSIARKIAEALDAAHERGIIHRDLKPANIKVSESGDVKVLDFGLAKFFSDDARSSDISNSPTLVQGTQSGVILGTAPYMSPEQAKGKTVDKRSDIWAFGCVLFEMLTGQQCFPGETLTDVLASVIRAEPEWNTIPKTTPGGVTRLLRSCLTKDPKQRLRDIGDVKLELDAPEPQVVAATPNALPSSVPRWIQFGSAAVLVLLAAVAGAFGYRWLSPKPPTPPVIRYSFSIPSDLTIQGGSRKRICISPDGTKVVFAANNKLYLRSVNSLSPVELQGSNNAESPIFSPDGEWVAFYRVDKLFRLSVNGGEAVLVCSKAGAPTSWGKDDSILMDSPYYGIARIQAAGGEPVPLIPRTTNADVFGNAQYLPDGRSFLYTRSTSAGEVETVVRSLTKNDDSVVMRGSGSDIQYVNAGYLVFSRRSPTASGVTLLAVPYDLAARKVQGNPVPLIGNVDYTGPDGMTHYAVSDNGVLTYIAANPDEVIGTKLLSVGSKGDQKELSAEKRNYSDPRVSPDGRFLATHLQGDKDDVWVVDLTRGVITRISTDPGEDETPVWSPDGRWIAWASTRTNSPRNIYRRAADGSGNEELLWSLDKHAHVRDWLPDGKGLILETQDKETSGDIIILQLDGTPKPVPYLQTRFNERNSRLSPDGRWIAYVSDESGREEIYVQSFPVPNSKILVTTNGGDQPVWSRNGKSLYFRSNGFMQETEFQSTPRPGFGPAKQLFKDQFANPQVGAHTGYDVFPDGRFLMIQSVVREKGHEDIVIVHNWFADLRMLVH